MQMKNILITPLLFLAANSFASQLHNYQDVKEAVLAGKSVRMVIEYAKCTATLQNFAAPSYFAAYTPNEIGINNDSKYAAASLLHFTLNDPQFPSKPVYEFARYTINDSDKLVLTYTVLNPVDYSLLTPQNTYTCKIGEGVKIYS